MNKEVNTMKGIDYAWGRPGGKEIADKDYEFVCRYLSLNPSKNITQKEILDLHANGLSIVLIWETTEGRPLGGFSAGHADSERARDMADRLGFPCTKPIYFACDKDFKESEQPLINKYFEGVSSNLRNGIKLTGAYGGYWVIKRLFDANLITYGWQTSAWSGGHWDKRVHIRQIRYDEKINNVQCDVNTSMKDDFGQWI